MVLQAPRLYRQAPTFGTSKTCHTGGHAKGSYFDLKVADYNRKHGQAPTFAASQVRARPPRNLPSTATADKEAAALREYAISLERKLAKFTADAVPQVAEPAQVPKADEAATAKTKAWVTAQIELHHKYNQSGPALDALQAQLASLQQAELETKSPLERIQRATKEAKEADRKVEQLRSHRTKLRTEMDTLERKLADNAALLEQAEIAAKKAHEQQAAAAASVAGADVAAVPAPPSTVNLLAAMSQEDCAELGVEPTLIVRLAALLAGKAAAAAPVPRDAWEATSPSPPAQATAAASPAPATPTAISMDVDFDAFLAANAGLDPTIRQQLREQHAAFARGSKRPRATAPSSEDQEPDP